MFGMAIACNNRGCAFKGLGQRDKAIADFKKALEINKDLQKAKDNLREMGLGASLADGGRGA